METRFKELKFQLEQFKRTFVCDAFEVGCYQKLQPCLVLLKCFMDAGYLFNS